MTSLNSISSFCVGKWALGYLLLVCVLMYHVHLHCYGIFNYICLT